MMLHLKLTLGDGSIWGVATRTAAPNSLTYKINVQEGPDSTLILPENLHSDTGRALISFDKETENDIIHVIGNVKKDDTDMILMYTNLDTLVALTNNLPTAMTIHKDSTDNH
ncbi:MAG TPA: hypothetical protein VFH28_00505 [Nitrososphaera sp.]|nr:hypothetical protein [Nitrososphaera sp.]